VGQETSTLNFGRSSEGGKKRKKGGGGCSHCRGSKGLKKEEEMNKKGEKGEEKMLSILTDPSVLLHRKREGEKGGTHARKNGEKGEKEKGGRDNFLDREWRSPNSKGGSKREALLFF